MAQIKIVGIMTGTSCDGLDASCLSVGPLGWTVLWGKSLPYPESLRKRVLRAQLPRSRLSLADWLKLDRDLGEWYGRESVKLVQAQDVDAIACHGQTLAHDPGNHTTLQVGDPFVIAQKTGLTVFSDFRRGDLAAGGQGAPLLPLYHRALAERTHGAADQVAFHNLGGISNITWLGKRGQVIAFDTGPANIWIDAATELVTGGKKKWDADGTLARQGNPDHAAIRKILKHPYFKRRAPKSTGRDDFPFELLRAATRVKGADLIATATEITIESIVIAYQQLERQGMKTRTIYTCGGGTKNSWMLARLADELPNVSVRTTSDLGIDPQMVESQAFAYFGWLSLQGKSLGGHWTGTRKFGSPAEIIPGKNWAKVLRKISKHR